MPCCSSSKKNQKKKLHNKQFNHLLVKLDISLKAHGGYEPSDPADDTQMELWYVGLTWEALIIASTLKTQTFLCEVSCSSCFLFFKIINTNVCQVHACLAFQRPGGTVSYLDMTDRIRLYTSAPTHQTGLILLSMQNCTS